MLIEGVISQSDVARALDVLGPLTWQSGRVHDETYGSQVKRNEELRGADNPGVKSVLNDLQQKIWKHPEFQVAAMPFKGAFLRFNRCKDGGFYGPHADSGLMNVPPIRSDLSCTLFLTDGYEGGELKTEKGTYKGPPGSVVVYPSNMIHEVTPVTKGERICAVMWVQSLIRDEFKRKIMGDLYRLGVSLRESEGITPRYTDTCGIYSNLLRVWAET